MSCHRQDRDTVRMIHQQCHSVNKKAQWYCSDIICYKPIIGSSLKNCRCVFCIPECHVLSPLTLINSHSMGNLPHHLLVLSFAQVSFHQGHELFFLTWMMVMKTHFLCWMKFHFQHSLTTLAAAVFDPARLAAAFRP